MQQIQVTCDFCKEDVITDDIVLKEETYNTNSTEVYWECPFCSKKHHVLFHNFKTKELQNKIKICENNGQKVKKKALIRKLKAELGNINKQY